MCDGVPEPGEILPVLPGHPLQGHRHVVQVGGELLGTGGTVADGLQDTRPGRVGSSGCEPANIVKLLVNCTPVNTKA